MSYVARRYSTRCRKTVQNWQGGGTSCGNAVWLRYLRPALDEASDAVAEGQWHAALGCLLGVMLIGINDDGWLTDQARLGPTLTLTLTLTHPNPTPQPQPLPQP